MELWFFGGVACGGILSVILFLTCFQRKQYLLLVCLNSLYVLYSTSMYILSVLDLQYGGDKHFPFFKLLETLSPTLSFMNGLFE